MPDGPCRLLIGIDEAGYGPNLGPLVIACSAWLLPLKNDLPVESLLAALQPAFQAKPWRPKSKFIPLGDSKAIHAGADKNIGLRVGVDYWLRQLAPLSLGGKGFIRQLDADFSADESKLAPWYRSVTDSTTHQDDDGPNVEVVERADAAVDRIGLKLVGLTAKIVDEASFNRGCQAFGNKAGLLSLESIALARRCLEAMVSIDRSWVRDRSLRSIHFFFDKHGGRNRYQAPLSQVMPELWFNRIIEGTLRSTYTSTWADLPIEISFVAKGDRWLPPALASMTAKRLREMSMAGFNQFWRSHLPDIAPTAGYPVDAARFRKAIESKAAELGFDEQTWWRCR